MRRPADPDTVSSDAVSTDAVPSDAVPADAVTAEAHPQVGGPLPRYGLEVLAVLGVSFGMSGVRALVNLVDRLTQPTALGNQTAVLNGTYVADREWLDVIYQVVDLATGTVAPLLALLLLSRSPGGRGFGIGFDRRWPRRELLLGAGFAALIGLPGLGLVYAAHEFGANVNIVASGLPDVWYRLPVLLLSALQNATAEEVVVVGYLLTRLRQLGWSTERAVLTSAVLRGSYHLYQGFGGFAGNAVMGLIFGWWFTRTRRVLPLLIAHFVIDAVSFIGYVYLHDRVSWI